MHGGLDAEQVVPDPEHDRSHGQLRAEHRHAELRVGDHAGEHLRREDVEPEVEEAEPEGDERRGCPRRFGQWLRLSALVGERSAT